MQTRTREGTDARVDRRPLEERTDEDLYKLASAYYIRTAGRGRAIRPDRRASTVDRSGSVPRVWLSDSRGDLITVLDVSLRCGRMHFDHPRPQ